MKKYSNLKIFLYPEKLEDIKKNIISAPLHIRLKPTNSCNHSCWYCCYKSDNLKLGEMMSKGDFIPAEKMFELIDDLISMNVKAVTLTGGGEPLIYPYIKEVIERLSAGHINIGILTNGSFLKGELAKLIKESCQWTRVSIDSWDNKSQQDSRHTAPRDFESIMDNLRHFNELKGKCFLSANLIINDKNKKQIYKIANKLKEIGVREIKLSACIIDNDYEKNNNYHTLIIDDILEEIKKVEILQDTEFTVTNKYHLTEAVFDKTFPECLSCQLTTVIGADCSVYSCQDKAYTESGLIGTIQNKSFKEFWYSEETQRKLKSINPANDCRHHCVASRKNEILHEYLSLDEDHKSFI